MSDGVKLINIEFIRLAGQQKLFLTCLLKPMTEFAKNSVLLNGGANW